MIPRGTIVITALPGEYGKPRPAVVVQSRDVRELTSSVICPLTTFDSGEGAHLLRPVVEPSTANGLELRSYVMVDKLIAMPTEKLTRQIGTLESDILAKVSVALTLLLGLT